MTYLFVKVWCGEAGKWFVGDCRASLAMTIIFI